MKGPHNIWRLVVTGATFARTGALGAVLHAFDAPPLIAPNCFATRMMVFRWCATSSAVPSIRNVAAAISSSFWQAIRW